MADWHPPSATPVTDWVPPSARRVIAEHTRGLPGMLQGLAQSAVENLPTIGATVGGTLGTLGGIGAAAGTGGLAAPAVPFGALEGAAGGGALGAAARLALNPLVGNTPVSQPPSLGQQATSVAGGGLQGVMQEVGGKALPLAARLSGKALMGAALSASRSLGAEFPGLAQSGLDAGQMVGARLAGLGKAVAGTGGITIEGGAPKIDALRAASSATEKRLAGMYRANGVQVPLQNISQRLVDNADDYLMQTQGRHILPVEAADIHKQVTDYAEQKLGRQVYGAGSTNVSLLSPEQTLVLKQEASRDIKPLFKAQRSGVVPAGNPDLAAAVYGSVKDEIRAQMPQMAEQAEKTEKLIGLRRAFLAREQPGQSPDLLTRMGERTAAYGTIAGLGGIGGAYGALTGGSPAERVTRGLAGAGIGATLGSPQALSLAALAVANPQFALLLQQAGRTAGAAVGQNWSRP